MISEPTMLPVLQSPGRASIQTTRGIPKMKCEARYPDEFLAQVLDVEIQGECFPRFPAHGIDQKRQAYVVRVLAKVSPRTKPKRREFFLVELNWCNQANRQIIEELRNGQLDILLHATTSIYSEDLREFAELVTEWLDTNPEWFQTDYEQKLDDWVDRDAEASIETLWQWLAARGKFYIYKEE